MAWRPPGDKPLSEPMIVRLPMHICVTRPQWVNTLWPRQNGHHFADDTFKHTFLNKDVRISIKISLKFVLMGPINNIPTLVQIRAWRQPGIKSLSEPMMFRSSSHICATRLQCVKKGLDENHTHVIHSNAIIMRSYFSRYYIQHCDDNRRT